MQQHNNNHGIPNANSNGGSSNTTNNRQITEGLNAIMESRTRSGKLDVTPQESALLHEVARDVLTKAALWGTAAVFVTAILTRPLKNFGVGLRLLRIPMFVISFGSGATVAVARATPEIVERVMLLDDSPLAKDFHDVFKKANPNHKILVAVEKKRRERAAEATARGILTDDGFGMMGDSNTDDSTANNSNNNDTFTTTDTFNTNDDGMSFANQHDNVPPKLQQPTQRRPTTTSPPAAIPDDLDAFFNGEPTSTKNAAAPLPKQNSQRGSSSSSSTRNTTTTSAGHKTWDDIRRERANGGGGGGGSAGN